MCACLVEGFGANWSLWCGDGERREVADGMRETLPTASSLMVGGLPKRREVESIFKLVEVHSPEQAGPAG